MDRCSCWAAVEINVIVFEDACLGKDACAGNGFIVGIDDNASDAFRGLKLAEIELIPRDILGADVVGVFYVEGRKGGGGYGVGFAVVGDVACARLHLKRGDRRSVV